MRNVYELKMRKQEREFGRARYIVEATNGYFVKVFRSKWDARDYANTHEMIVYSDNHSESVRVQVRP
jgi:hypothetical protein